MSDALHAARIVPPPATRRSPGSSRRAGSGGHAAPELLSIRGLRSLGANLCEEVPDGPAIVIGDEFLDAPCPCASSCRVNGQWRDARCV